MRRTRVGEEVRVTGRDDAVDHELSRVAVIGMEAVLLPRVVAEHDIGADRRAPARTRRRRVRASASSSPSTASRKCTARAPRVRAAARCSSLAGGDQRRGVGAGSHVPFEPSVSTAQLDVRARARPGGERGTAPELDVVGMGADREDPAGSREPGSLTAWAWPRARRRGRRDRRGRRRRTRGRGRARRARARPSRRASAGVTAERARTVGEAELDGRGHRQHRRAVVAVARHQRDHRLGRRRGPDGRRSRANGRSAWAITTRRHPRRGGGRARRRRRASSEPGIGDAPSRSRSRAHVVHLGVGRHHDDGQRRCRVHDRARPSVAPSATRVAGSSVSARRALPSANARIGITTPRVRRRAAMCRCGRSRRNIAARMLPTVESATSVAVIGAGSWGTTVAAIMSEHAPTTLWGRDRRPGRTRSATGTRTRATSPASSSRRRCARRPTSTPRAPAPASW